jgi:hypothetical protein
MLAKWWKVLKAPIPLEALNKWKNFKDKYNNNIFAPLAEYIKKE